MLRCTLPSLISQNQTLSALQCGGPDLGCYAICPNTDLAGIGVRAAFYSQSVLNTMLVVFSPRDAVASAWASTLLTASLVIAAIVQKINQSITLHHAILILNFTTISCISSLAVAPLLPIWSMNASDYFSHEVTRNAESGLHPLHTDDVLVKDFLANARKKDIKAEQNKERLILTIALLTQVVLQWAWGIILFVSPAYSQPCYNGRTILVFFLYSMQLRDIDDKFFVIWPLWLLFSLGITLVLTIVLSISAPSRAYNYSSRMSHRTNTITPGTRSPQLPLYRQWWQTLLSVIPPWKDLTRQAIMWGNFVVLGIWIGYVVSSELQSKNNCIFPGEDSMAGIGQITAVMLSLVPMWSLTVAMYRYPSWLRRNLRRQERMQMHKQSMIDAAASAGEPGAGSASPAGADVHSGVRTPTAPPELVQVHARDVEMHAESSANTLHRASAAAQTQDAQPRRSVMDVHIPNSSMDIEQNWIELRPVSLS